MSVDQAMAFIALVGESPGLQAEINGYSGKGIFARLIALGARHGFHFSEDQYREAVVALADGELSDEALDEVLRDTGLK